MATLVERARRARRLKKQIDKIRAQGNTIVEIADCLEIGHARFYTYAEGKNSPLKEEDYQYIMTSLKLLEDKPLPAKEPKQQELFPAVVEPQLDEEVTNLVRKVAELKARNEYLENTLQQMREALGA